MSPLSHISTIIILSILQHREYFDIAESIMSILFSWSISESISALSTCSTAFLRILHMSSITEDIFSILKTLNISKAF